MSEYPKLFNHKKYPLHTVFQEEECQERDTGTIFAECLLELHEDQKN